VRRPQSGGSIAGLRLQPRLASPYANLPSTLMTGVAANRGTARGAGSRSAVPGQARFPFFFQCPEGLAIRWFIVSGLTQAAERCQSMALYREANERACKSIRGLFLRDRAQRIGRAHAVQGVQSQSAMRLTFAPTGARRRWLIKPHCFPRVRVRRGVRARFLYHLNAPLCFPKMCNTNRPSATPTPTQEARTSHRGAPPSHSIAANGLRTPIGITITQNQRTSTVIHRAHFFRRHMPQDSTANGSAIPSEIGALKALIVSATARRP